MNFETGISNTPYPYRPEFVSLVPERVAVEYPAFSELVNNAASCSMHLRGAIEQDLDWVLGLAAKNPADEFLKIVSDLGVPTMPAVATNLRKAKKRGSILIALADLGGVWQLDVVMAALTRFADCAVQHLLASLVKKAIGDGNLPDRDGNGDTEASGLVALAMGKMGANELNYSSDIDLIMLFDGDRYKKDDFTRAQRALIGVTRRFSSTMSRKTSDGYIFRCDLRLRPDPLVTQVCMSIDAAERYYESHGRTWERAAYIKARPCAGDIEAGASFIRTLTPFIWRRNLDYAAVQDARNMQSLIKESKGLRGPISFSGHNIKLGRGGIREIEFLVQTIQIIAGGKDPDLRVASTLDGLVALRLKNWIDSDTERKLKKSYKYLRWLENRLQMIRDAQTHSLPKSRQEIERLACLCGEHDSAALREQVVSVLKNVNIATERFYSAKFPSRDKSSDFKFTKFEKDFCDFWRYLPILRNDRAKEIFARIIPEILLQLRRASEPREALSQFDEFIRKLPAGIQLFSMFEANPKLISLLTDICATVPDLAKYLSCNAQVFEAVIDRNFFAPVPNVDTLTLESVQTAARFESFEEKIMASRLWAKEQHFRIGVQHLRGLSRWYEAAASYSDLAQATLATLLPIAIDHVAQRHGMEDIGDVAILALDSLGAGTLTSKSGLNFILLYSSQPEDELRLEGKVAPPILYAQVTRTLVTALTSKIKEGQLYKISDRIRPSGKTGLVATSVTAFKAYQIERAGTWEHLALTRSRVIAGPDRIARWIEQVRCEIISREISSAKLAQDICALRREFVDRPISTRVSDDWELRLGRGKLVDIEGFLQAGALLMGSRSTTINEHLGATLSIGWITKGQAEVLHATYRLLRAVLQVARLTANGRFNPYRIGTGAADFLLRETSEKDLAALQKRIRDSSAECDSIISFALSEIPHRLASGITWN